MDLVINSIMTSDGSIKQIKTPSSALMAHSAGQMHKFLTSYQLNTVYIIKEISFITSS